jgi:5'-nucleotidase
LSEPYVTLTLLHTNDIHSHFEESAKIAEYVAQVRRKVPAEQLMLVDCGDFLDRVRIETEGTQGAANRAVLEAIGYEAVTIGNNEGLTYTPDELDALFDGMPVPVVCANMIYQGSEQRPAWMVPALTIEKSGVRIGYIGLTAAFNDYYRLLGWNALDPFETAKHWVEKLRKQVDVLVVLSHLGIRHDEKLARTVEGIDVILGGHTHHLLETPLRIGRTTIAAAGKFGHHIGRLELRYSHHTGELQISGGCDSVDHLPEHTGVSRLVDSFREQAKKVMSRPVALLSEPLALDPYMESPLATLLACAARQTTSAEIGLVNAGQLLEGLPAGPVTEETIHAICPSPINLCTMTLQGGQILRALEESLLPEFYKLEIRGFGFRGRMLGTLCFDGMKIMADLGRSPYDKIVEVVVNGEPLDVKRDYRVGTLDMFTFGAGYVGLKEGRDVRYLLPAFIRDVLADALNDPPLVASCRNPRRQLMGQDV